MQNRINVLLNAHLLKNTFLEMSLPAISSILEELSVPN